MADIKVPSTPRAAYDPNRSANALLLTHVRELEKAVADAGRRVHRKKPRTEEQVAAYLRHLNRALHQQVLLPAIHRRPLDVPSAEPAKAPSRAKSKTARRKRKAASKPRSKATARSRGRARRKS